MAQDLLRYDLLAQRALRGMLRDILVDTAKNGLPGDHHFYIAFDTRAPGVRVSQRLREQYPEEMTVVLQHQFWDLAVTEQAFEVGMSFGNVPERLFVPFEAIKGFFDPSVQFGLQFEVAHEGEDTAARPKAGEDGAPGERPAAKGGARGPNAVPSGQAEAKPHPANGDDPKPREPREGEQDADGEPPARVVSLDAFRKKT